MERRIIATLVPVKRRQQTVLVFQWGAIGLLVSALAGVALGLARWRVPGLTFSPALLTTLFLGGPALGALFALIPSRTLRLAASAVDTQYRLKDRTVSALDFVSRDRATPIHELQLADAEAHLARVDPKAVVPFRTPKVVPYALVACAAALALLVWPRTAPLQARPALPIERVVAAAEEARENLEELETLARREKDPALDKLVQKLVEQLEEMKKPGVDVKEALAKLSEMQAAITAQQAEYNVGLVDAQMQSLGEVLASSQALEGAGQALQQGKYEKAADNLEKADLQFDRKESKALKDKLKKAAKAMSDAGLGALSEATTELSDSLGNESECQGACNKIGKLARAQASRKKINDLLASQCQSLSECKGQCQNPKNSLARNRVRKKSENPSSNWGMGISGNTDGDPTKLDSARNKTQLTGQAGEGTSEIESTHSPEGRQTASREYRENYQKYRKMTEAALNSEPIPLGQRQTIRRYFELIRPTGDEARETDAAPATTPAPGN